MNERYVLDANVLIQAYVLEDHTKRVQTLLQALAKEDADEFNIPEFCLLECTNVLWKHVRLHGMPVETARRSMKEMRSPSNRFITARSISDYRQIWQSTTRYTFLWRNNSDVHL